MSDVSMATGESQHQRPKTPVAYLRQRQQGSGGVTRHYDSSSCGTVAPPSHKVTFLRDSQVEHAFIWRVALDVFVFCSRCPVHYGDASLMVAVVIDVDDQPCRQLQGRYPSGAVAVVVVSWLLVGITIPH